MEYLNGGVYSACYSLHKSSKVTQRPTFQLYFNRNSKWVKIVTPRDLFKGLRRGMRRHPVGVWSLFFFSDWQYSTSGCRHTWHWSQRSAACCVHKRTRCSAWWYLSFYYFQLYFILCQPANFMNVWSRSRTVKRIKCCTFPDLWPYVIASSAGSCIKKTWSSDWIHLLKEIHFIFVNRYHLNRFKKRKVFWGGPCYTIWNLQEH